MTTLSVSIYRLSLFTKPAAKPTSKNLFIVGVMADVQTVRLAHVAHSTPVFAALFKDVKNAAFLRRQLIEANADYEYAFLDASTVSGQVKLASLSRYLALRLQSS